MIMVLRANSWHNRLVRKFYGYECQDNICVYTRAVLFALMLCACIAVAVSAITVGTFFGVGWTVGWIVAMVVEGQFIIPVGRDEWQGGLVFLTLLLAFFTALVFGCSRLGRLYKSRHRFLPALPPDNFASKAWRSFRDRTCVRLSFK
jgi:hypothetical protein